MNTSIGIKTITELLGQDPAESIKNNRKLYDQAVGFQERPIVIFGASFIGKRVLEKLKLVGLSPVAFADNNPLLAGQAIDGIKILSRQDAEKAYGASAVFVVAIYNHQEIQEQLRNDGCLYVVPYTYLYWKYAEQCLPCYCFDWPNKIFQESEAVLKAFALLEDDLSREEYIAQLRWRVLMEEKKLPPPQNLQEIYFPPDLVELKDDEVFVDAGAFTGDTIQEIFKRKGNNFKGKIFSMEPDPKNRAVLVQYVASLSTKERESIQIFPVAVGERKEMIRFDAAGDSGSAANPKGALEVESVALDQLLEKSAPPTFIKMDVEGLEPQALLGCQKIIKEYQPVLAICIYHEQSHLWSIPLIINKLSDQYHFFIRRYLGEFWDIVCYAIPKNRLLIKNK